MCLIGPVSYAYAGNFEDGVSALKKNDYKTAYALFLIEAKKGDALAQVNLGLMYSKAQACCRITKRLFKWFRLAANQGDAYAQFNIGVMYVTAREWCRITKRLLDV